MARTLAVHRLLIALTTLALIVSCARAESTTSSGDRGHPLQPSTDTSGATSLQGASTSSHTTLSERQVLMRLTEEWRHRQDDLLNRVLSRPLVSGVLTGDSRKPRAETSTAANGHVSDSDDGHVWHNTTLSERVSAVAAHLARKRIHVTRVVSASGEVGPHPNSTDSTPTESAAPTPEAAPRWAVAASVERDEASDEPVAALPVTVPPLNALTKETVVVVSDSDALLSRRAVRVPVKAVGNSYNVVEFEGINGHTLSAIVQLRSHQYEQAIPVDNCEGMYVNVEMRNHWTSSTAPPTTLAPGERPSANITANSDSAWSQIWDPIVQLFDMSIFCQVVSSISMRITNIPKTEPYYVIIKSGVSSGSYYYNYDVNESDFSCAMEVYLSQRSTKRDKLLRTLFALVLPLLVLITPMPFTLWRSDIIQQLIGDVDFGEWLWFIPYYLRYLIIKWTVGAYNAIYEWRLERRTQAAQRALEERHRQLMHASEVTIEGGAAGPAGGTAGPQTFTEPKAEPPLLTGRLDDEREDTLRPRVPGLRTGAHVGGGNTSTTSAGTARGDFMERFNQPAAAAAAPPEAAAPQRHVGVAESVEDERNTAMVAIHDDGTHVTGASPSHDVPDAEAEVERGSTVSSIMVGQVEGAEHRTADADAAVTAIEVDTASPMTATGGGFGRQRGVASGRGYLFSTAADDTAVPREISSEVPPSGATAAAAPAPSQGPVAVEAEEEEEEKFCRICRDGEEMERLIAPCQCTGSVRWIHRSCLDHWRLESAKRNLTNVNNCEICKQPFTIGIKKSTLLWQSSRQFVRTLILIFTSVTVFLLIIVLSHSIIGELSCTGANHQVAYSTMFSFQGMIVSLFNYSLIVFMVMFAHLIVYSWFRGRRDVEEYVNEMHVVPPFWTRWNALKIALVSLTLSAQAASMGYIVKYLSYVTSNMAWNWELSPFLGGVCLIFFYSSMMGPADAIRGCITRAREARRNDQEVVIEDVDTEAAAVGQTPAATGVDPSTAAPATNHGPSVAGRPDADPDDVDFTRHFSVPADRRVIRAMEYCPPRRTAPTS